MSDNETEFVASVAPEAAPDAPAEVGTDQFDVMTDDELRAFIKVRDGRSPHPATGREKLLKSARGDAATSAQIESDEPEAAPQVDPAPESEALPEPGPAAQPEAQMHAEAEAQAPITHHSPAAASAALDAVELRVAELVSYLKGQLHHFEDGVDGVCKLIGDRLKAAL